MLPSIFEVFIMKSASVSSFTLSERAARVHAYVVQKHSRFDREAAERVAAGVEPYWFEPTKALAKRVRAALVAEGVKIGHESSLHLTARLQGFSDYFSAPKGPDALATVVFGPEAVALSSPDWRTCTHALVDACERWLDSHPNSRLLRLEVSPNLLAIYGVAAAASGEGGVSTPVAAVRPLVGGTWLEGAASALETLRRHVEESRRATLDGLALARFCSSRDRDALPYCPWPVTQASDAPYSELVLMHQDHELDAGYEIVRGDEVACWLQLLEALAAQQPSAIRLDDDGAWLSGNERYLWEVVTLRPHEVVPGLSHANLPFDESRHLLRRFQAAVRGHNLQPLRDGARRRFGGIDEPPSHCQLDAHSVLRSLRKRGETWEGFCASIGLEGQLPNKPVELGVFLTLAEHLEHADPTSLLHRPTRSELSAVVDDQLLRALMPRVDHVRYRVASGVEISQREVLQEAVQDFAASIAMRNGALNIKPALPDVVYAGDCEELRLALEGVGLVMFIGLMPHLAPVSEDIRAKFPQVGRYAFGTTLFIDIDVAA
jgi:hypothetical protein